MLNLLREFIAFQTTERNGFDKSKCLDWVQENFFAKSTVPIQRGNVKDAPYLWLPHHNSQLIWFAHIDVVPADDLLFTLRIKDDRALGRGVKDMKGAALPFLMAYREMCGTEKFQSHTSPPVSILLTSDEEIGGHTIPALIR